MKPETIFYPVAALAALTFVVLLLIPYQRLRAVFRRQVAPADFKFGESSKVPPHVSIPNRNLMNLLEIPVLFYVVCLASYVTHTVDMAAVISAWVYVGLRAAHSAIHLSYNDVRHRLGLFALSNVALIVLWIRWFASLMSR